MLILIPALDAAFQKHKRIRVLCQLTPDFEDFTTGSMWDDAKLGLAHLKAWERIAVLTDVHWLANAMRMFAFLLPGLVKVFSNEEQSDTEPALSGSASATEHTLAKPLNGIVASCISAPKVRRQAHLERCIIQWG